MSDPLFQFGPLSQHVGTIGRRTHFERQVSCCRCGLASCQLRLSRDCQEKSESVLCFICQEFEQKVAKAAKGQMELPIVRSLRVLRGLLFKSKSSGEISLYAGSQFFVAYRLASQDAPRTAPPPAETTRTGSQDGEMTKVTVTANE